MAVYNTHGAALKTGGATIAQVESITPPSESRGSEDVPLHDTAAGSVMHKLVDAMRSLGTFSITIVEDFGAATHGTATGLFSFLADTEEREYKIELTSGHVLNLTGFITGRTPQAMPANRGVPRVDYEFTQTAVMTVTPPA